MQELILASSSPHRTALMRRLRVPFRGIAPGVDEAPRDDESAAARAGRLAREKAMAVLHDTPDHIVIGSDQVAAFGAAVLAKPGTAAEAREQLELVSGRTLRFHTAVCVIDGRSGDRHQSMDVTQVTFRTLSRSEIERYVERDEPMGCAGAFKVESLGIGLFERIESNDPTALIGLPLIALSAMLRGLGYTLP